MENTISFLVAEQDTMLVEQVLAWIKGLYPDSHTRYANGEVTLTSEYASAARLGHAWRCGLLNENLFRRGANHRAGVLADLVA